MSVQVSQRRQILDHLVKYGTITSWTAIQEYHITRLSEYIRQLRSEGKNITSEWKEHNGKRFVEYRLFNDYKPVKIGVEMNGYRKLMVNVGSN